MSVYISTTVSVSGYEFIGMCMTICESVSLDVTACVSLCIL